MEKINSEIEVQEDEKIMMYDAITGETTEVDIDKLKQEVKEKLGSQSINNITTSVPEIFNDNGFESKVGVQAPVGKVTASILRKGSGLLVARNLVLTAAHCVWNEETKEVLKDWTFYAGYNGKVLEVNGTKMQSGWSKVYYSRNWMNSVGNNADYDWALCELYLPLGDYGIGYWRSAVPPTSGFVGQLIGVMGYPTDENYGGGAYQWHRCGVCQEYRRAHFYT